MLELARAGDWEEVHRLSVQIHDLHAAWRPDLYFHTEEPYPQGQFLQDIAGRRVYVARLDGLIAGYAVVSVQEKTGPGTIARRLMRLDSICVEESIRGNGIGKAMVRDIRALAKAFRCTQLILGVHPENDAAVGFYQKCGFSIRTINMDMDI